MDLWEYVKILQAPLLLMIGDQSTIVGEDQQNIFKELLPDIVIRVVKNAGHIIVHDNFDAFTKEVVEFIKSV